MNQKLKAFGNSFLIHLGVAGIILLTSNLKIKEEKILEIDLSTFHISEERHTTYKSGNKEEKRQENPYSQHKTHVASTKVQKEAKHIQYSESQNLEPPQKPLTSPKVINPDTNQTESLAQKGENTSKAQANTGAETKLNKGPLQSLSSEHSPSEIAPPRQGQTKASQESPKEEYIKTQFSVISSIVQKNISYPPLARRMGWEGKVVLLIKLCEDGTLKEVRVLESSGYELLDRNAVETVQKVSKYFPKPSVEVVVKLPVVYRLE